MRRSSFSEEQIIATLREQEAGSATADVCRRHGRRAGRLAWPATISRPASRSRTRLSNASTGGCATSA